jgi:hypothetical protein
MIEELLEDFVVPAFSGLSTKDQAIVSSAISLKRIAEALEFIASVMSEPQEEDDEELDG